jgi:hypothetical protein
VYNANHLFGFFSIFNPDIVKGAEVYKGAFPAQYGGRLSSVIDVKLKEGNKNKFGTSGGVGLITSRLTVEGPIQKGKSSFIISGRRTYIEPVINYINKQHVNDPNYEIIPNYYFYDLNTKVNYELGKKDRVYASFYMGRDAFQYRTKTNFDFIWGNTVGTLRWNHVFGTKMFCNTSILLSNSLILMIILWLPISMMWLLKQILNISQTTNMKLSSGPISHNTILVLAVCNRAPKTEA